MSMSFGSYIVKNPEEYNKLIEQCFKKSKNTDNSTKTEKEAETKKESDSKGAQAATSASGVSCMSGASGSSGDNFGVKVQLDQILNKFKAGVLNGKDAVNKIQSIPGVTNISKTEGVNIVITFTYDGQNYSAQCKNKELEGDSNNINGASGASGVSGSSGSISGQKELKELLAKYQEEGCTKEEIMNVIYKLGISSHTENGKITFRYEGKSYSLSYTDFEEEVNQEPIITTEKDENGNVIKRTEVRPLPNGGTVKIEQSVEEKAKQYRIVLNIEYKDKKGNVTGTLRHVFPPVYFGQTTERKFEYDDDGKIKSIIDNKTDKECDIYDRLKFHYDENGNLTKIEGRDSYTIEGELAQFINEYPNKSILSDDEAAKLLELLEKQHVSRTYSGTSIQFRAAGNSFFYKLGENWQG